MRKLFFVLLIAVVALPVVYGVERKTSKESGGSGSARTSRTEKREAKPEKRESKPSSDRGSMNPGPAERAGIKGVKVGERHGYDVRLRPDGGKNSDGGVYVGGRVDF